MHRLFSYIFPDQASNLAPSVDAIYFVLLGLSTFIILLVFVPAFRAKQDVVPGRYTTEWFTPTKPGRYHLFARNTAAPTIRQWTDGSLMEPAEHAEWLNKGAVSESLGAEGERDFHTLGCSGCHEDRSCGYALSRANLLDLLPARFPKMGRTGSFRPAERWRKRLRSRFYQESARAKTENGNSFLSLSRMELAKTGGKKSVAPFKGYYPLALELCAPSGPNAR
jgi:hypothetical protein